MRFLSRFTVLALLSLVGTMACAQEAAPTEAGETAAVETGEASSPDLQQRVDAFFGVIVSNLMAPILFFEVPLPGAEWLQGAPEAGEAGAESPPPGIPLIILVLVMGGVFFTFRYGWVNILLFRHAIAVVRGHYDDPNDPGEISHFQALSSALAATVGLGNIAGVALAITMGGPGAVFWMWVTAIFGMSMKFSSCTLAQLYRRVGPDGHVLGGPMVYLKEGLHDVAPGFGTVLGMIFSPLFAVLTIFASFGGGNLFQSNQTYFILAQQFGLEDSLAFKLIVGVVLAILVALVVVGGIRRIGEVTSKLVPGMCLGYLFVAGIIIVANFTHIPTMMIDIISQAFSPDAIYGGFVGVLIMGMRRAAFSNEAGLGSAAIAHAAAKTDEPIREGLVAMLGPFIDTIVVCTATAFVILITDAHLAFRETAESVGGVRVTANAFATLGWIFPYFLALAVFVFAYSTLIGWAYYGERATEYLFGTAGLLPFRVVYVIVVVMGPLLSLQSVVDFADMMLLSMAFPNILGMVLLSGKVRKLKNDYVARLRSGAMVAER